MSEYIFDPEVREYDVDHDMRETLDHLEIPEDMRARLIREAAKSALQHAARKNPELVADKNRIVKLTYVGQITIGELLDS